MQYYDEIGHINVGTGEANIIAFTGEINWDTSKPNGTPRKVLNLDKIKSLGWSPKITLKDDIQPTYNWYKKNVII